MDNAGCLQCGESTQFECINVNLIRDNLHFRIRHKPISYLECSRILKLELFLPVTEMFLSGIGHATTLSLGQW